MIILHIDTTIRESLKLTLSIDEKIKERVYATTNAKSQAILGSIRIFLEEEHVTLAMLTAITVNPGPGSFTGVRVGVAIANALGYALHIPVNGSDTDLVDPIYT